MVKFIKILLFLLYAFLFVCGFNCQPPNKSVEFKNKLQPYIKKIESKTPLSSADVQKSTSIIKDYYTYLENKNIPYGKAAKDVVTDNRSFGKLANIYLKESAEKELHKKSKKDIEDLSAKVRVELAFADASLRAQKKDEKIPYSAIANYHYKVFGYEGLSKYAWGGTIFEEFMGSGSWMNFGGYDTKPKMKLLDLVKAIINGEVKKGVSAREALKSVLYILKNHMDQALLGLANRIKIELYKEKGEFKISDYDLGFLNR